MEQIKIDVVKQWLINKKEFSTLEVIKTLETENATLKEQLNVAQKGNEKYQKQRNASKQWYLDHKESRKDYYKEYRKNNKKKCSEYRQRYYQTHKTERKEKARQYAKDYYWAHKEEINEKQKHKRMYGTYELFGCSN